jgi:hypothetical protein
MTDREALTAALENFDINVFDFAEFKVVAEAARERLALMPPYPAALVERIAAVLQDVALDRINNGLIDNPYPGIAVAFAVLDALNGETPEDYHAWQRKNEAPTVYSDPS